MQDYIIKDPDGKIVAKYRRESEPHYHPDDHTVEQVDNVDNHTVDYRADWWI